MTIKLPPPRQRYNEQVDWFVRASEEPARAERIVQVLTVDIPRVWRDEFTDSAEDDLPPGLLTLVEALERWTDIEFYLDEDED